RPDSISVASINASTGKVVLFSIPRNLQNEQFAADSPLWDVYPDGYSCGDECIVNSLYTDVQQNHQDLYPDAEDHSDEGMMADASGILGLVVSVYMMVDMDGVTDLLDSYGDVA